MIQRRIERVSHVEGRRLELLGRLWHWSTPCRLESHRLIDGSLAPMRFEEGLLYHHCVHGRAHPGVLS